MNFLVFPLVFVVDIISWSLGIATLEFLILFIMVTLLFLRLSWRVCHLRSINRAATLVLGSYVCVAYLAVGQCTLSMSFTKIFWCGSQMVEQYSRKGLTKVS